MNILLHETSLYNEINTETIIKSTNPIQVFFRCFQYGLNFLYQRIRTTNRNKIHSHSRTNAGNDDQHNWAQYTKNVDIA